MKRHISVLIPRLAIPGQKIGGAERVAINLANGIAAVGIPTDLVVFRPESMLQDEISQTVHVVSLEARNWLEAFPRLRRYLLDARPTAILAQDNRAGILAMLARKSTNVSTRVIVTIHDTLSQRWSETSIWKKKFARNFVRPFLLKADAVVAVSREAAEDLVSLIRLPRNHVKVIYNPVLSDGIFDKAKEEPQLPWFGSKDPPVILGVGRLCKQKDFETLLKAFALVRQKLEAKLVILGEGEMRHELEKLARELSIEHDVMMPGVVKNPFPYISRAAVFVLSSRHEGLPTVLIEALALGTPIVSTNCPSGPAEILENGRWGRLVPPGDPQAMAEAIVERLGEPRRPVPHEAWTRFTIEESVERYLQLIKESHKRGP
ncbi:MAG: glycosyltransferase [Candidatus Verstraetearchaeota archaeon]|nr:glycosyltransferase [Candidatus Verstraetearchaeota archaeon]